MYFKSENLLNQERILETPCFLIPWCTCSQKLWVQILRIDSWCEEKYQRKYSSIFISYFGFNEANTNILHLTSHIYSNIDLEIWRIENYWGSQGFTRASFLGHCVGLRAEVTGVVMSSPRCWAILFKQRESSGLAALASAEARTCHFNQDTEEAGTFCSIAHSCRREARLSAHLALSTLEFVH